MKLQARFVQLPLEFDAERLADEVGKLGEGAWLPHPQRFAGNDFLPLISARGELANESFEHEMRPTPLLLQCPYLIDVLASLGVTLGRTRLMRLSGHAEVTPHVDVHYYWRDRMRVHVPIVTQPTVRFHCGDAEIHMAAGECWLFDTWSMHRVINDAERARIHLVVDTVGGEGFWNLAARGRAPDQPNAGWLARRVEPMGAKPAELDYENFNLPLVMTPWEAREHITFLLGELAPNGPALPATVQATTRFLHVWRALWSAHGEHQVGWPRYRRALDVFVRDLQGARAETLKLRNGGDLVQSLFSLVINVALADRSRDDGGGESRSDPRAAQPVAPPARPAALAMPTAPDPLFDRPIFIVNPPRSGSSLLFETLAQAPGIYTVGGESHGLIEGVAQLRVGARQSNRLTAADASPEVAATLRARFAGALRDRAGVPPLRGVRVRMLEKTPKNALRIPLLAAAFPEARFIYLYRDPRQVLASMMEGWESGRFVTYPDLAGWVGAHKWSFLLTPGWRDLIELPLHQVVAAQWASATQVLLDDFEQLAADRRVVARYDALIAAPGEEVERLCAAMDLEWDRVLGSDLPLAAHTVSKPSDDKWRERGGEVEAVLPPIAATMERAAAMAAR